MATSYSSFSNPKPPIDFLEPITFSDISATTKPGEVRNLNGAQVMDTDDASHYGRGETSLANRISSAYLVYEERNPVTTGSSAFSCINRGASA